MHEIPAICGASQNVTFHQRESVIETVSFPWHGFAPLMLT